MNPRHPTPLVVFWWRHPGRTCPTLTARLTDTAWVCPTPTGRNQSDTTGRGAHT